jgi:aminotransferase
VIEKMGLVNDLVYICAPAPLQHGVADALPMPDAYYADMLDAYTAKRTLMCDTLEACGFDFHRPDGAYYVLANFEALSRTRPGFDDDRQATTTLIETAGVACVPGNSFFADPEDGRYWLRFCYAKEMDVLEDACRRLRAAFATVAA